MLALAEETYMGRKNTNWEKLRKEQRTSENKPTLNTVVFDTDKQLLVLMGDTHIGSKFFDEELHKKHLDYCLENKLPVLLMGDMIETATRDSVGAGVYEQDEIVDEQYEHAIHLFKPLADEGLILGMHPGNHEYRIYKSSGFDITKAMCRELGVPSFGFGKLHYIRVGNQGYTLYTTHGSSGSRLPHTKIKSVIDLERLADAEIYAMGHLHQLTHHAGKFYDVDKRTRTVIEKRKHYILTGSYLNHWGSYGHMKNMQPSINGCVEIEFNGLEHKIQVALKDE